MDVGETKTVRPSGVIARPADSPFWAGTGGIVTGFPARPAAIVIGVSCDFWPRTKAVLPSGAITMAIGMPATLIGGRAVPVVVEIGTTSPDCWGTTYTVLPSGVAASMPIQDDPILPAPPHPGAQCVIKYCSQRRFVRQRHLEHLP